MVTTARQAHAGLLARLEIICPDSHLTIIKRWEDVLDTWPDDDTLIELREDIVQAIEWR
jgi:hypothetical protein